MFRSTLLSLALFSLTVPAQALATTWTIDPMHAVAQFSVRHMMVSNVRGQFSKVTGTVDFDGRNLSNAKVDAIIDTTTLNTLEPRRDEHLKSADFFDVSKYPTMTFKSKRIQPISPGKFKMTGSLTVRGITREVCLDVDGPSPAVKDPFGKWRMGATATTKLNRKDFGMIWNGLLDNGGAIVGDDVLVTLDIELLRNTDVASIGANATAK